MKQTENTAIVLRYANYRENDRMLTLFNPIKGLMEVVSRGCRRPKSHLISASELFALGDFELFEKNGRYTLTGFTLIENFYPLRKDYDRLTCGMYLLSLCEAAVQPDQAAQELFLLLLHTLSRLTFTDQPREPLLAGFLTQFSAIEGFRPRLRHCVRCGRRLAADEPAYFDLREGGVCCAAHREPGMPVITRQETAFLEEVLVSPPSAWTEDAEHKAPLPLIRQYAEMRMDKSLRVKL